MFPGNSMGAIVVLVILWITICNGKNIYDEIDPNTSEGIAESKRPSSSFYAGSRYGRSQNTGPINSSLRVTPRRDFHFLRYGKRAIYHDENEITRKTYEPYRENSLICSYLGVRDYYRCWKGQDRRIEHLDQNTRPQIDGNKQQ